MPATLLPKQQTTTTFCARPDQDPLLLCSNLTPIPAPFHCS